MCYLDTNIKTGENTPFRISIYDKREDFAFRIVNFPHMDSNIPANPAYGVYTPISIKVASEKNDAWSIFHSPRCIIVPSLVNYVPATSLNLESKRCWRFYQYATPAER